MVIVKVTPRCPGEPHAVMAGQYGDIIADIMEAGYKVTGLQTFHLDYGNAEEFYEIYRGKNGGAKHNQTTVEYVKGYSGLIAV